MTHTPSKSAAERQLFRLLNEIGIIAQLSGNAFEKTMPEGMTLSQFTVLNHLTRLGGNRTPLQIAIALQVTKGTMTNTLQHLERGGFIEVTPDDKDKRSKRIDLTERGRDMHQATVQSIAPELSHLASIIPASRIDAALPLLEELRKVLDQRRG